MPTSTAHRSKPGTGAPAGAPRPIDDTRITDISELSPPAHLLREFPASERPATTTYEARHAIHRVLHGADDRLLVVVGPCSIHDYDAAIDYATRLAALKQELADRLIIVMRVYFEKPRTTVGWKGLINDPRLDDSFRINEGLRLARRILLEINELDLPRRDRVPRHDHAAVHRRPDRVGRDRRADDREPGPPAAGVAACRARSASRTAPTAT